MRKIYIASGLKNYLNVIRLQSELASEGIGVTFDWASEFQKQLAFGQRPTQADKSNLASAMENGVREAEVLLLMMPAKRGAHVEFGIAIGAGKPVVVFNEDEKEDISFYLLPQVVGVYRKKWEAVTAVKRMLDEGAEQV